jgi:hypothetical protein
VAGPTRSKSKNGEDRVRFLGIAWLAAFLASSYVHERYIHELVCMVLEWRAWSFSCPWFLTLHTPSSPALQVDKNMHYICNLRIHFFLRVTEIPVLPQEEAGDDQYIYMIDKLLSTTTFPPEV